MPTHLPVNAISQMLHESCGRYDIVSNRGVLEGGITRSVLSGLELTRVSQNSLRITRNEACLKQDHNDHFFMIFQEAGRATMCQGEFETLLLPGDLLVVDASLRSEFIYSGHLSSQLSLHLPREKMKQRYGKRMKAGFSLKRACPFNVALSAILEKILKSPVEQPNYLTESFYSILGSSLLDYYDTPTSNHLKSQEMLISSALSLISQHYNDPNLNATTLCDLLNVKPRQLQRCFRALGDTPTNHILAYRMQQAYNMLSSPRYTNTLSITETIYRCGFNDISYFYRKFRQYYGKPPGEIFKAYHEPS